ncbi:hypothetical protein HNQ51_000501 [Inhella inkyongensis]|uniref:DUF4243 domain-containing protein n=1 Tax=Inhella inkyongensis TaxID=392593 RepID=A0A840S1C0_9BURK|nr:questin oxidase family protein [Inhella inkyongensis]MBB5203208.1 hypothetical protein [Inhella inkyongensis]
MNSTAPVAAATTPRTTLHRLLKDALAFGPHYDGAMSNHLPMALHAAWELGASEARLQALFAHESGKLEPAPATQPLPALARQPQGWLAWRGQREAYPVLLAYFRERLAGASADAVLTEHLPALLPGWHAFAFHGLIRTAHAYEAGLQDELAAALATWAAWYETLPPGQAPEARLALADWVTAWRADAGGWRSDLPMITWRVQAATLSPCYTRWAEALAPAPNLAERVDELQDLALHIYLHSRNFTVLHLITGLRALRVLLPLLPANGAHEALQDILARALLTGWLAARLQWLPEEAMPQPLPDWASLKADALTRSDEHVIKLAHACWQEDGRRPDPRWRQAVRLLLAHGHGRPATAS